MKKDDKEPALAMVIVSVLVIFVCIGMALLNRYGFPPGW